MDHSNILTVDLAFSVEVEGSTTYFSMLSDAQLPIPLCDENTPFILPGDGTIAGFAQLFSDGFTPTAVDVVLERLGLKVNRPIVNFLFPISMFDY